MSAVRSGDALRLPADVPILDRSALCLALHEEMERACPREAAVDVVERAMMRVRAYIAARDAAHRPRQPR